MKYKNYKCQQCGCDDFDIVPSKTTKEVFVICKKCLAQLHSLNREERRDLNRRLISNAKKRNKNIISQIRKGMTNEV